MRYSFEFKLECVHQYKKDGSYPPTPNRVKQSTFRGKIRNWSRLYDRHGANILKHSHENKKWKPEEKLVLINQYKSGKSLTSVDNVNVKLTKNVNYRFTTFVNLDLCGESIKMSFVLYERPVIFTI